MAAQGTDLLADPETWEAHLRWESAGDQVLAPKGISALCGYRRAALPPQLMSDLAAIHPAANDDNSPFHLFGQGDGLALSGEVDLFSSDSLERALEFAAGPGQLPALDLEALDFIDHHGFEVLAARGCDLRNPPPVVERLRELLAS